MYSSIAEQWHTIGVLSFKDKNRWFHRCLQNKNFILEIELTSVIAYHLLILEIFFKNNYSESVANSIWQIIFAFTSLKLIVWSVCWVNFFFYLDLYFLQNNERQHVVVFFSHPMQGKLTVIDRLSELAQMYQNDMKTCLYSTFSHLKDLFKSEKVLFSHTTVVMRWCLSETQLRI